MLDARDPLRGLEQPATQLRSASAVQLDAAHVQIDQQHRVDVVAEPHVVHMPQAAHEQAGANQQGYGESTLQNYERCAGARPAVRTFAGASLQVAGEVRPASLEHGSEPGKEADDERRGGGKQQRPVVCQHARGG